MKQLNKRFTIKLRFLREIDEQLSNAEIVEEKGRIYGVVILSSRVKVGIDGQEEVYTITGVLKSSPTGSIILGSSPIGKAILGRKVGEDVFAQTPVGGKKKKICLLCDLISEVGHKSVFSSFRGRRPADSVGRPKEFPPRGHGAQRYRSR